ncbi:hypothetical protein B0O99DRAFT_682880 [Bisporella sp. PMI_857]|nr:hypothetical protein B0O99DRAFT_682880 [Bisporella sp. PMI_857]
MPNWFPVGTNGNDSGWRLDIVSLLAVIGESSIAEHSQALTASWTCMLPRIIPAPQVLLKPARLARLPQTNSAVVGIHNGTLVPSLNYFANILHPLDDLPRYGFKVLKITHRNDSIRWLGCSPPSNSTLNIPPNHTITGDPGKPKPRVPPHKLSPLNILSIGSCLLTIGLLVLAIIIEDATAIIALGTISLASSLCGLASWWAPLLQPRLFRSKVPPGDVAIRTREGAFLIVKCNEEIARELYFGTEECRYHVQIQTISDLGGFGTLLLMISVVLLGNCNFTMQAAIGASYILLNGLFWGASLIPKDKFWDLSGYMIEDITLNDAKDADLIQSDGLEGLPSFTRTLWYAIRETKKIGWVKKCGAAPDTAEWGEWLKLAESNAIDGNRLWDAVAMRQDIVGQTDSLQQAKTAAHNDTAEQHAPAFEIPADERK